MGLEIVMHVAAAGVRRALIRARRAEELPIQSRAELLSELLAAPQQGRAPIVQRARDLGVPDRRLARRRARRVRGARRRPATAERPPSSPRLRRRPRARSRRCAPTAGRGTARAPARRWCSCGCTATDPGVARLGRGRSGDRRGACRACGRGCRPRSCAAGSEARTRDRRGCSSSAAEAKAAVTAARAAGPVNSAVPFDSVGLRRALVEWYASDIAQEAVTTVLAPLARLGGVRAERLIQTLHVYLDQQGSLTQDGGGAEPAPQRGRVPDQQDLRAARGGPGQPGRPAAAPAGLPRPRAGHEAARVTLAGQAHATAPATSAAASSVRSGLWNRTTSSSSSASTTIVAPSCDLAREQRAARSASRPRAG